MSQRNLKLLPRQEKTRERKIPKVIHFQLNDIILHFSENVNRIKAQFTIAKNLEQNDKLENAITIWSSQIVLLESAYDYYLHELTKYGLHEMLLGNWSKTQPYYKLPVKMELVDQAINNIENSEWIVKYANDSNRKYTFMSYKATKQQLALLDIDIKQVANSVFGNNKPLEKMEKFLEDLYELRNIIAHQAGRRSIDAQLTHINESIVHKSVKTIEDIVCSIQKQAVQK